MLVLNCGSQSFRYKIFDDDLKLVKEKKAAVQDLLEELEELKDYSGKINKIGHRVVHGGAKFRQPVKITPRILRQLATYNKLAPLHNPFNILGIKTALKIFPRAEQVAVFDTGFYKDLPDQARYYPLPGGITKKYGFERFGFHGISHQYAAEKAAEKIGRPLKELKIISCHLGGGASITAVKNGKAVDTSMGFTPLEGLMMMTRSGDIDPGIVIELCRKLSVEKADEILNHQSGIKGICGFSDMRKVLNRAEQGDRKAKLALRMFVCRIQKYIGAYFAVLGGCDILVFTGAIGEGSEKIRQMVCQNLNILKGQVKTKVLAVETNEELAIAKQLKQYANKI